jgi:biotin carboxyl carrier protein
MFKVKVGGRTLDVQTDDSGIRVDDQPFHWDIIRSAPGHFHILHEGKSYRAEVEKVESGSKTFFIKINGKRYPVEVKDKFDLLLERMGMHSGTAGKVNALKAPMPGLIIDLKIEEGKLVKPGDPLLVLEAMKMENVIKSSGEGIVKSIKVKKGDSVEKGQLLVEFSKP